jgi:hypothetical protein
MALALIVQHASFRVWRTQHKDVFMATKLFALAAIVVSLACGACFGPSDKDYTPPSPAENVDSPPPGGMQENPGQPRP